MAAFLLATFYVSMALAALAIEYLFQGAGLVPSQTHPQILEASITLNYTTILNVFSLAIAGLLVIRFVRTGGAAMLKMM
jgi:hypothetical protein